MLNAVAIPNYLPATQGGVNRVIFMFVESEMYLSSSF
jgi:hypothetical protein